MKKIIKISKIVGAILLAIALINYMPVFVGKQQEHTTTRKVLATGELKSDKYVVSAKEMTISRVLPETQVDILKGKFNMSKSSVKIYNNSQEMIEVQNGNVTTGMMLSYEGGQEQYIISVIGDINQDGDMGEIELNLLIKHIVGLEDKQLEGIEQKSADINGDGNIDQIDLTILIRWIVYGELEIPEAKTSEAPIINVVEGTEGKNKWYTSNVSLTIEEAQDEQVEIEKIIYTINEGEEKELKEGEIITIEEEGRHKIQAWAYSKEGYKSKITTKELRIEKEVKTVEIETSSTTSTITAQVKAETESGIANYTYYIGTIADDETIKYSKGIESTENTYTFTELKENTRYAIKVEAKSNAGNTLEQKTEEQTKEMPQINDGNLEIDTTTPGGSEEDNPGGSEGNNSGWTNGNVTITLKPSEDLKDTDLEYSTDGGETWEKYDEEDKIKVEENGTIQIRPTDGTNTGEIIEIEINNIDKTKPEGTLKIESKTTKEITVSIKNSKDEQSGIEKYTYYIAEENEQEEIQYTKIEEGLNTEYTYTDLKHNQKYIVKVEIQDKAGNITELEETVQTDKLPTVNTANVEIEYSNTEWTNENVTVTIKAKGNLNIEECKLEYSIDSGKTWTEYKKEVEIEIEENTEIIVKLTDGVNDQEIARGKVSNIDKQKPEGTIEVKGVETDKIEIQLQGTDTLSGIEKYTYYIGTQNKQGQIEYEKYLEKTPTEAAIQETYKYEELTQNTKHYIKVEIQDKAGNIQEIITNATTQKIPELNDNNLQIEIPTEEWIGTDGTITLKPSEELGEDIYLEYSKDGGETWEKYDEEDKIKVEENGTIQVRPTDGTNHGEIIEIEINNIDKTAPKVEIQEKEITSKTIKINVTAKEEQSGIATYIYYLGTKNEQEEIVYEKQAETTEGEYEYTNLQDGKEYNIKVEVKDQVNNIGTAEKTIQTVKIPTGETYIEITQNTKEWTKGNVLVTISYTQNLYQVQYSIDGNNWIDIARKTRRS